MLEGDDPVGGAFAIVLRPHPGEFATDFFQKNANAQGLARGRRGGGKGHEHC